MCLGYVLRRFQPPHPTRFARHLPLQGKARELRWRKVMVGVYIIWCVNAMKTRLSYLAFFMFKAVYKETRGVEYPDNLEGEIP